MSENTERDTHFAGFAKLLYEDFLQLQREDKSSLMEMLGSDYLETWRAKVERCITQRAYDLVEYAYENRPFIPHIASGIVLSNEEIIKEVPDMTEWPETVS